MKETQLDMKVIVSRRAKIAECECDCEINL